jgi:hypothetical protein
MVLQSGVVPTVLLIQIIAAPSEHAWSLILVHALSGITVLVTLWSALPYLRGLAIAARADDPAASH